MDKSRRHFLRALVPALAGAGFLTARASHAAAEGERVLAATSGEQPVSLDAAAGGAPLRIMLTPPPAAASRDLAKAVQMAASSRQIYLSLQGLRIDRPVSAVFDVYLGLPEGTAPSPGDAYHLGDFNFFDAQSGRKSAVFNVTARVQALAGQGLLGERVAVTIVGKGTPGQAAGSAKAAIARVELLAAAP